MPIGKAANATTDADRISTIMANLQQRGAARLRSVRTLTGTIGSLFQKTLAEEELARRLEQRETQQLITTTGGKVTCALPWRQLQSFRSRLSTRTGQYQDTL